MGFQSRAITLLLTCSLVGTVSRSEEKTPETGLTDQAWAVLHEGLTSDKATPRVDSVRSLALMRHDQRAIAFAERALTDRDRRVRAIAAATLGELASYRSIPKLRTALNDREITVALSAAHSLDLLKDKSAYEIYYAILMGDRKSHEGLVESQLDRLKDPKQLVQLGFQEGVGFVPFGGMGYEAYRQIRGNDPSPVRAVAARSLARDPDQLSGDALIQVALVDKSELVRLAALDALSVRDDRHSIDRLAKNLSESNLAVRYRTAAVILHLSATNGRTRKN